MCYMLCYHHYITNYQLLFCFASVAQAPLKTGCSLATPVFICYGELSIWKTQKQVRSFVTQKRQVQTLPRLNVPCPS